MPYHLFQCDHSLTVKADLSWGGGQQRKKSNFSTITVEAVQLCKANQKQTNKLTEPFGLILRLYSLIRGGPIYYN